MRTRRILLENILCFALLAALPALLCLCRGLPLSLERALLLPPWEEALPGELAIEQDPFSVQHTLQTYPWYAFLHEAARHHDSLLWNPNEGFGTPFMALWRTRVFSPFSIPFYFLPLDTAFRWSVLLKLMLAGWAAYYAARRFRLEPSIALFAGFAYQVSGPVFLWSADTMADALPWFPLLVVAAERLMFGEFRAWPLAALALAMMGFGGSPETMATSIAFIVLYMLARRVRDKRWIHLRVALSGLLVAVFFSLLLLAIQVIPFAEFVTQGHIENQLPRISFNFGDLTALVTPGLIGNARGNAGHCVQLLHAGLVPLLLLPLWWSLRSFVGKALRRRMESLFMASLAFVAIPVLFGESISQVYVLELLGPQHFLIAHSLAFAFIVAAGAQEWNELKPDQCRQALKRLKWMIPLLWGGGLVLWGILIWLAAPAGSILLALLVPLGVAFALVIILGITLIHPTVRGMGYGLSFVSTLALLWAYAPATPNTPQDQSFPDTPFTASLRSMHTRIGGSQVLKQWPLAANNIEQVSNPSGVSLFRYQSFIERIKSDTLLLRRCGIQAMLLTKEDIRGAFAEIRPDLQMQSVYATGAALFRDLRAMPKARMIYQGRRVDRYDPSQISSSQPPVLEGSTLPEKDEGPIANVTLERGQTNTEAAVQIEKTRPGVLVLADAWYPGWTATLDGKSIDIFPVDGMFRGIEVGEGEHLVAFSYEPLSFELGKWISAFSAICVLISLRHVLLRKRQPFDGLS